MSFIFLLIGHRTQEILEGHESVTGQYDSAVYKLTQISNTANFFQDLMDKTKLVFVGTSSLLLLIRTTGYCQIQVLYILLKY
jgi:hypothetical protein